ncbi:EamA family transporter [Leptolyngbya sp. 'hensonii']|uniref:DMT family transporter n=1 Tax=Leptolyngbya sp. 'hensonii' TaxID=1922337 RepID=UPI00094F5365|nr:DMT family transporter [Leptolyngbya sp. 'hensonii']OLP16748.1 EamA family transporter [Leptolyngbya sp. 'hensonii']
MTQQLQLELPVNTQAKLPAITAILALCIALVSIASAAIFIKLGEREISPYATAFNRFWITTLALTLWNGFKSITAPSELEESLEPNPYNGVVIGQLFLVGLFLSADLVLWAWSLTQTSVANATLFANLTPVFTCLIAWLVWGRRFERQFLIGMVIAIAGICAIGLGDFHLAPGKVQGDIAALLAAVSFSIYLLLLERLQLRLKNSAICFWSSGIATLVCLPIVLIDQNPVFPSSWQGWLTVICLSVVCQIIGQGLLIHSLNHLSAEFVALFLLLEPVLAALGAWAFFSENLSLFNLAAFGIVITGIYLALSSSASCLSHGEKPQGCDSHS